jgi:hypothetical protein
MFLQQERQAMWIRNSISTELVVAPKVLKLRQ